MTEFTVTIGRIGLLLQTKIFNVCMPLEVTYVSCQAVGVFLFWFGFGVCVVVVVVVQMVRYMVKGEPEVRQTCSRPGHQDHSTTKCSS